MCEHYIARGLCTDFPDWSIAAAGSEAELKIGYEYGRLVTGVEQETEQQTDFIDEEADGDQLVPDPQEERSMVATSSEVSIVPVSLCLRYHSLCSTVCKV